MDFPIYFTLFYKNTRMPLAGMKKHILKQNAEVRTHPDKRRDNCPLDPNTFLKMQYLNSE